MAGRYSKEYRPNEFVKLPFEEVAKVMAMKEQRYQQGYLAHSAYQQEMGKQEDRAIDVDYSNFLMNNAKTKVDNLVADTYGGDYGEGASDILRTLSNEANNPYYKMRKKLVEGEKLERDLEMKLNADGKALAFRKDYTNKAYWDNTNNKANTEFISDIQGELQHDDEMMKAWKDVMTQQQTSNEQSYEQAYNGGKGVKNVGNKSIVSQKTTGYHGISPDQYKHDQPGAYQRYKQSTSYKQLKRQLSELENNGKEISDEQADKIIRDRFNKIGAPLVQWDPITSYKETVVGNAPGYDANGNKIEQKKIDITTKPLNQQTELFNNQIANKQSYAINYQKEKLKPAFNYVKTKVLNTINNSSGEVDKLIKEKLSQVEIKVKYNGTPIKTNLSELWDKIDGLGDNNTKIIFGMSASELKNDVRNNIFTLKGKERDKYIKETARTMYSFLNPGGDYLAEYKPDLLRTGIHDKIDSKINNVSDKLNSSLTLNNLEKNHSEIFNDPETKAILSQYNFPSYLKDKPIQEAFDWVEKEEGNAMQKTQNSQQTINNPKAANAFIDMITNQSFDSNAQAYVTSSGKKGASDVTDKISMSTAIGRINAYRTKNDTSKKTGLVAFNGKNIVIHNSPTSYITIPMTKYTSDPKMEALFSINEQVLRAYNSKHKKFENIEVPGNGVVKVIPGDGIYMGNKKLSLQGWNDELGTMYLKYMKPDVLSDSKNISNNYSQQEEELPVE